MYKVDKKYGNLYRKIYINSIFEHLLASNFAASLFLKFSNGQKILRDSSDVYFSQSFPKISEEKSCFLNKIFHKFEIVVCFAPLSHGVERNTILNFDSITESVKSKNSIAWWKRGEKGEVGRVVLAYKSDEEERRAARAATFPYSLLTDRMFFCSCDCVGIRSEHTAKTSTICKTDSSLERVGLCGNVALYTRSL